MRTQSGNAKIAGAEIQRDAASAATRHVGPTADRYQSALERYLDAVAAEPEEHAAVGVAFPPLTVGQVMSAAVVSAHEDAQFKEIARALDRNGISGVPVIDRGRRVVGMVTATDLLARITGDVVPAPRGHRFGARADVHRKQSALVAGDLMTAPAITTTVHASIADAARLASRSRVRSLPVVDADGVLVGIVTRADLVRVFLRSDADIERDVQRDVIHRPGAVGTGWVRVAVDEGVVTLTGSVDTAVRAERLALAAARVAGVVDVRSQIDFEVNDAVLPRHV